ncbi:MAG TPA: hypothetical protein VMT63_07495 [Bacteroidales bacterium]|nr:hypothetical protein [Bacteroidales bacterium]
MKRILKRILYTVLFLLAAIIISGLVMAFLPGRFNPAPAGITPAEAVKLRESLPVPHQQFSASDGATLSLRRWDANKAAP